MFGNSKKRERDQVETILATLLEFSRKGNTLHVSKMLYDRIENELIQYDRRFTAMQVTDRIERKDRIVKDKKSGKYVVEEGKVIPAKHVLVYRDPYIGAIKILPKEGK